MWPWSLLTPHQVRVVNDPARFRVLLVGRRGGKTICAVADSAAAMLGSRQLTLYLAKTIGSAREIMWEPFKRLNREHRWGFRFNEALHIVTHPNGSRMLVRGIDDRDELEKLRGPSFDRIYIDECGTHKPSMLQYLIEEVLDATLMDRAESTMWLLGTPTSQAFGHFYKASTGLDDGTGKISGYSVHRWTAADNPHVNFERHVFDPSDGVLARRGWTVETPAFRREYLAEWIVDTARLVFRFERGRNVIDKLPELRHRDRWVKALALDFGVNDATAAVRICWPELYGQGTYITRARSWRGLAPSDAADLIAQDVAEWQPDIVVGDSGGIGKAFLQEYGKRYPGLMAIQPAEKRDKRAHLEIVSDLLYTASGYERTGLDDIAKHRGLYVVDGETAELQRQFGSIIWDETREDIADGQNDDEAMGAVYGVVRSPAYGNATREPEPIEDVTGTTWQRVGRDPYANVPAHLKDFAKGWNRK